MVRRCKNYTDQEKTKLLEIIEKYKDIVDSKDSDKKALLKKEVIWLEISKEFNKISTSGQRNTYQLRNLYKNMKRRPKKSDNVENVSGQGASSQINQPKIKLSAYARNVSVTKESTSKMVEKNVLKSELIDSKDNIKIENESNPNSTQMKNITTLYLISTPKPPKPKPTGFTMKLRRHFEEIKTENVQENVQIKQEMEDMDVTSNEPEQVQTRRTVEVSTNTSPIKNDNQQMVSWINAKIELEKMQMKCALEEHKEKMKLLQQQYFLMEKENEQKIRNLMLEKELLTKSNRASFPGN